MATCRFCQDRIKSDEPEVDQAIGFHAACLAQMVMGSAVLTAACEAHASEVNHAS